MQPVNFSIITDAGIQHLGGYTISLLHLNDDTPYLNDDIEYMDDGIQYLDECVNDTQHVDECGKYMDITEVSNLLLNDSINDIIHLDDEATHLNNWTYLSRWN
jgi:hypothetical protein